MAPLGGLLPLGLAHAKRKPLTREQRMQQRSNAINHLLRGPKGACLAAIIPGDSAAEAVLTTGVLSFINLYNLILVVRVLLTWFPNPPGFIIGPVSTLADPYLNLFRGIIPPLGGSVDLSPVLAFLSINVFTNAAEALPCELPADLQEGGRKTEAVDAHSEKRRNAAGVMGSKVNLQPFFDGLRHRMGRQ